MKNVLRYPLSVFFVILLFSLSCSNDLRQRDNLEEQNLVQLRERIRQDALERWEGLKKTLAITTKSITERGDEETAPCNCSYKIEEIDIQTPEGHPDYEINFYSSEDCDPNNPFACIFFSGLYFSGEICGDCYPDGCCDWWEEIPPQGYFPFNCQVPAFSVFPVTFASIWEDANCINAGELLDWSITFRIYCQESEPNPSCGPGGGYGFVSEPITLSYPGYNNNGYWDFADIKLRSNKESGG